MKKNILYLFVIPLIFFSCSAKNKYYMSIDSIVPNDDVSFEKTYTLKLTDTDIEDLYFKEYSLYIKYALSKKGYVFKEEDANLIVFVDYGNGQPRTFYQSYYIPIYGTTNYMSYGNVGGNSVQLQTTSFGQTGAIYGTSSYVKYSNYINLYACDKKKLEQNKKIEFLWQTSIYYVNDTGDLREQFPVMINVALPYIAEDTYKEIIINKEMSNEDNSRFVKNSSRKELKYIKVKDFFNLDKIKKYQEQSKDFFENNKKYLSENIMDNKYKDYYTNDKNYEYFSDIDSLLQVLKQKTNPNGKPVSKTDSERKQQEYNDKNISNFRILENYILQQIKQGVPVAK